MKVIDDLRELNTIITAQWAGFKELPDDLRTKLVESGIFTLEERHIQSLRDAIALYEQLNPQEARVWMDVAESEIGVKEVSGPGYHPRIIEYFKSTTFHATSDEVPWCSAFFNWVLMAAGYQRTRSAAAASWLFAGKTLAEPTYGCGVVMRRAGRQESDYLKLTPGQSTYPPAHVAFFVSDLGRTVACLGGNQGDAVCSQPFPKEMVLRYFWPEKEIQ